MLCESVEVVTRNTTVSVSLVEGDERQKFRHFKLQSSETNSIEAADTHEGATIETSQNVSFTDNDGGTMVHMPNTDNTVAKVDGTLDASLGAFLSRPTMISNVTWTTATAEGLFNNVNCWSDFLQNPVIKKKIDNYAFLRGNLHVKFLINGTPFQYGTMRVGYQPLLGLNTNKVRASSSSTDVLVPYSQMRGVYLYPQANAGGEISLPFLYHKNWLDITSLTDVSQMGTLHYVVYAPLRVAVTGGSSAVSVRTYAWMTNVELMGPTNKLSLQSSDEYGEGKISRPASAIAAVAGALSQIPYIRPFARATQIGASAVATIASLFGYTNVPVIADVHGFMPMNGPMLASSAIGTAVQKLTLDPKQELSIDPSPHGIGSEDELVLSYLKQKESFLAYFEWATGDSVGTQLYAQRITPMLYRSTDIVGIGPATVGQRTYHIPLSYLGNMFRNWRGDIIVRVKIVCTKFHKGRLKIQYDPVETLTSTDVPENAVYSHILDVGETDDMEFRIPYHQDWAWLATNHDIATNWTTTGALAPRRGIDNGSICIRVANQLTSPASGSVRALVYVRGAENFEFANPMDVLGGINTQPSFFALQSEDKTDVLCQQTSFGNPTMVSDNRYGLNFGEAVLSLRDVLHRHVTTDVVNPRVASGSYFSFIRKVYRRMPQANGYNANYASTITAPNLVNPGTTPYNYSQMHPMPYVTGMYAGYRGSTNYVLTPSQDLVAGVSDVRVVRAITATGENGTDQYSTVDNIAAPSASLGAYWLNTTNQFARAGLSGLAITSTLTNGSLSFNLPDYNGFNFSLVRPADYGVGSGADGTREQGARLQILLKGPSTAVTNSTTIMTAAGSGPDFTCLYFVCCPTLDVPTVAIVPP